MVGMNHKAGRNANRLSGDAPGDNVLASKSLAFILRTRKDLERCSSD